MSTTLPCVIFDEIFRYLGTDKIIICRLCKKKKDYFMKTPIKFYVKKLVGIVSQMQNSYPEKKFTLDGRLVGDIGEVLAAEKYMIELNEGLTKHHDAVCTDGTNRKVQIKATMKNALTFPCDHIPDYYIGIKINSEGEMKEIFNGPGNLIKKKLINRQITKTNLHSISINTLLKLNEKVPKEQRIPERKK